MEPFPAPGPDRMSNILLYVRRALTQPAVQKVEITPKGIEVVREMDSPDDPVVPVGVDSVDMAFLLDHVEMTPYPFNPEEHPMYVLYGAMREIHKTRRKVHTIVAPGWPMFAAWLGVEADKEPPTDIFGAKVAFVPSTITNDRVVILGAPHISLFLSDVDMAVAVDLGV